MLKLICLRSPSIHVVRSFAALRSVAGVVISIVSAGRWMWIDAAAAAGYCAVLLMLTSGLDVSCFAAAERRSPGRRRLWIVKAVKSSQSVMRRCCCTLQRRYGTAASRKTTHDDCRWCGSAAAAGEAVLMVIRMFRHFVIFVVIKIVHTRTVVWCQTRVVTYVVFTGSCRFAFIFIGLRSFVFSPSILKPDLDLKT